MAIPNYTYLKLKIPGPNRVITVHGSFKKSYECDVESIKHATAVLASLELAALQQGLRKGEPDSKRSSDTFEIVDDTKEVPVDESNPNGKTVQVGTSLTPK